jgi:hypothetical protein
MTVNERKIKTINIEYAGIKKEGNKRFRHMKRLRTIDHCRTINAFFYLLWHIELFKCTDSIVAVEKIKM